MIMYTKHHIIPLHEWKRRINPKATRYDKEFNAPDNVVWLTLEQHIQAHRLLWELHGDRFDEIAWQTLSGMIGKEEAHRKAISVSSSRHLIGNKHALGSIHTEEWKMEKSQFMLGKKMSLGYKHPEKRKQEQSIRMKQIPKLTCVHCKKIGDRLNMTRYHFDNCKEKFL